MQVGTWFYVNGVNIIVEKVAVLVGVDFWVLPIIVIEIKVGHIYHFDPLVPAGRDL